MASKLLRNENGAGVKVIAVLGSIGAGKSTLVKKCSRLPTFGIIEECLVDYCTFDSYNPLELLYTDPVRNFTAAQMHFIDCLNETLGKQIQSTRHKVLVTDRSVYCPHPFIETNYQQRVITPFTRDYLRCKTSEAAKRSITTNKIDYVGVFYLDTPPSLCLERISKRERECEQTIPIEYLNNLDKEYKSHLDLWRAKIGENRVMVVDGTEQSAIIFDKFCDFVKNLAEMDQFD